MIRKLFILTLLLACLLPAAAETGPDYDKVEALLKRAIEDGAFPGCTVVVGHEDKILWSRAFGWTDYSRKTPVTKKTIYDLASCTKVAGTTSVFIRLVALGKIKVSDSVSQYLPEFLELAPSDEDRALRKTITVEHLLTHTGGLISWKPLYRTLSSYDAILQEIMKTPLEKPPGERFRYSDLGMILLGEIASRAGGKPLPELEQELVFRPLKMRDTLRNPPEKLWSRIPPTEQLPGTNVCVHGVVHDENARAAGGVTGHAGLFSTAEDLSRLAAELLRSLDGKSALFPKDVVTEFCRERKAGTNATHGLGWDSYNHKNADGQTTRAIGHTGFTGTSIRIDMDQKRYFILLTNRVHPTRDNDKVGKVRAELARLVFGLGSTR